MTHGRQIVSDYHIHSNHSVDGLDSIESLCWRALALGYREIAVTEHAEWAGGEGGFPNAPAYFRELDRCRTQFAPLGLTVLSGVELGNPHEYGAEARTLLYSYPFDIRIASLHWLYGENIHMVSCFAGRDPLDVYADYFAALGQMAAGFTEIDIIAHFDRIFWRGALIGATFDLRTLENVIRESLATIAWRGLALELNTRLLDHSPSWADALVTILGWYREEGGRHIVVNSDAHRTSQMGVNLPIARQLLAEVGLQPVTLGAGRALPQLAPT